MVKEMETEEMDIIRDLKVSRMDTVISLDIDTTICVLVDRLLTVQMDAQTLAIKILFWRTIFIIENNGPLFVIISALDLKISWAGIQAVWYLETLIIQKAQKVDSRKSTKKSTEWVDWGVQNKGKGQVLISIMFRSK